MQQKVFHNQTLDCLFCQELSDRQSEQVRGGDGCIAWSIGFADVVRPSTSKAPDAIYFETTADRSPTGLTAVTEKNPRIRSVVPM